MKHLAIAGLLLVSCALVAPACLAGGTPAAGTASAREFVQKFYDGYLKLTDGDHAQDPEEIALQTSPQSFDAALMQALKEDLAAAAKSPDEIVGLDFDPFLNAQDLCAPYTAGKVTQDGDTYKVEVFGHGCGEKPGQPTVIPILKQRQGSWVFVNFIYPGNGDLLSVLRDLKKGREHPSN
jgi:hypothetical protein